LSQTPDIVGRTFRFALAIVKLSGELDGTSTTQRVLSNQVLRSGTSVGANVEEAQAAESKADFIHKYNIALKEARETRYWLRLLSASDIAEKTNLDSLIKESDEVCRILAQITINARRKE
jgi:four helix bundle protein